MERPGSLWRPIRLTFSQLLDRIEQLDAALTEARDHYTELSTEYEAALREHRQRIHREELDGSGHRGRDLTARRKERLDMLRAEVTAEGRRLRRERDDLAQRQVDALRALRRYSPRDHEAVVAVKLQGERQEVVAQRAGVSQGSISRRVRRGVEFLDAYLAGGGALSTETLSLDAVTRVMGLTRHQLVQALASELSTDDLAAALKVDPELLTWSLHLARTKPNSLRTIRSFYTHYGDDIEDAEKELGIPAEDLLAWFQRSRSPATIELDEAEIAGQQGLIGLLLRPRDNRWGVDLLLWQEAPDGNPYDFLMIDGKDGHTFDTVGEALDSARDLMEWEGDIVGRYVDEHPGQLTLDMTGPDAADN